MKQLTVSLPGREYDILIARGILDEAGGRIRAVLPRAGRAAVVSDSNVAPLYAQRVLDSLAGAGFACELFTVPAGEKSKCAGELSELWEKFMRFGLTRSDVVVALGGGVVGDLSGFAAATALRGVAFVQIPTTLLAQVDSSVGGKVAIDLKAGKNLAGAFYQPRLVLMDPDTLDTLPNTVFADGMAEVVKYGCIADEAFLVRLEKAPTRAGVMADIESVLYTCCAIKRDVVVEDELDTGRRMMLNFGHTLGHAYELAGGYETWTHGQAVAAGMVQASRLGAQLGVSPPELAGRIAALVTALGLPERIECTAADYEAAVGLDKKGDGGAITLVLADRPGHTVFHKMKKSQLLDLLK
ncbi:MAG: 3-dehydroquinate synthase [Oscillospiraceae bacterium]|nr:3-dehydroquinate synthase [Oscillospiraceae bacterium]